MSSSLTHTESRTTTTVISTTAALPVKAAAADASLPSDWELTKRSFSLREGGHPLFFAAMVVLLTMPDLFDLGSSASPLPALVRRGLAALPGIPGALGAVKALSLAGREFWASGIVGKLGIAGLMTVGLGTWTTAIYWTHAGILSSLDIALRYPKSRLGQWAKQRKIQDTKLVTAAEWIKCAKVVVRNQLLVNVPVGLFFFRYLYNWSVARRVGAAAVAAGTLALESPAALAWASTLPTPITVLKDLAVSLAIEEVLFYSAHRLFHYGWFYKSFHKLHHEFTAPIGLAATYAHPLEHTLANLTPLMMGPALFAMHPFSVVIWLTMAVTNTVHTHSGYELFGWPTARKHDYHHYAFIYQFGVSGFVDKFFGTDGGDKYRRYVAKYDERIKAIKAGKLTPAQADADDEADPKLK
ncbi:hypothetical protein BC828DRAFT_387801 [Blastocladiella britannica]|nr:hypothetical protein BC828DRAFT_387801 [Blastocladiella britannica]